MQTILLAIHLLLALSIVGMVLLQRSEGGALGIGGGDGLKTGRAPSNPLARVTAILGVAFFTTSITLTLLAQQNRSGSLLDNVPPTQQVPAIQKSLPKPQPDAGR